MECSECKKYLMVSNSKFEAINDDNPDTPTEIFSVLTMVCINPKCDSYCGVDLNKPLKVAKIIRNKVG